MHGTGKPHGGQEQRGKGEAERERKRERAQKTDRQTAETP